MPEEKKNAVCFRDNSSTKYQIISSDEITPGGRGPRSVSLLLSQQWCNEQLAKRPYTPAHYKLLSKHKKRPLRNWRHWAKCKDFAARYIREREYKIKEISSVLRPYSIWEFVRWEQSKYLEKQISAEICRNVYNFYFCLFVFSTSAILATAIFHQSRILLHIKMQSSKINNEK